MKVKYSHPAIPPKNIDIYEVYDVETLIKLGLTKDAIEVLFAEVEEVKKNEKIIK